MKKLLVDSSRWTTDFLNYEHKIEKDFSDKIIKAYEQEDGSIRHIKKMTYREQNQIQSLIVRVVVTIDTGNLFKETFSYEIYTDELIDFISLRIGYGDNITLFKKTDLCKITDFIINSINNKKVYTKQKCIK